MGRFRFPGRKSNGSVRVATNPSDSETYVLGDRTYTFKTVTVLAFDVLIGAGASDTAVNLAAIINASATKPSAGISARIDAVDNLNVHLFGDAVGEKGNVSQVDGTSGNLTLSGATLLGGQEKDFQTVVLETYTVVQNDIDGTLQVEIKTAVGTPRIHSAEVWSSAGVLKGTLTNAVTVSGDLIVVDDTGGVDVVLGDEIRFIYSE